MEDSKVTRLAAVAANAPRPVRAVSTKVIQPRPIRDEVVG